MKLLQRISTCAAVTLVAAALVPVALGSNGGKGMSSLSLVVLASSGNASASVAPQWGGRVMFSVTTGASYPAVQLACYQGDSLVFNQIVGAFPSYGGSQVFSLDSPQWSGGGADCSAWLTTTSANGKQTTLATLAFSVNA